MRKNTRQKILDSARNLFHINGYNGVSLQDIADDVGISKGNLTYHFNKKEDIMEGLLLENQPFDFPDSLKILADMDEVLIHMQQVVEQHSYYFLYYTQLSQLSPRIAEMQNCNYRTIRNFFKKAFHNFYEEGFLKKETFSGEYNCVIDTLLMASIYWGPFSSLQESISVHRDYRYHAWSIIHHLLTEKGEKELKEIIQL